MNPRPRVLLVDDNPIYVDQVVKAFEEKGFEITGCKQPAEMLGWRARQKFDFDLILLDLELGEKADGSWLSAQQLLPHLKTYAPSSKVVVITVARFSVEAAVRCIELGALAVFPKQVEIGELCGLAEVYGRLGDPLNTRQELIELLWEGLAQDPSGQRLEMLVTNLFESMPTFRVIETNLSTNAGSIDVLVENLNEHDFWKGLSLHVAIECKNHSRPPEPRDFNQLKEVVRSRPRCEAGILVSMSNFTSSFQRRQGEAHQVDDVDIFGLGADHLGELVRTAYDKREELLREILERQ
jgi:DNA-binding response OmpR family regulator